MSDSNRGANGSVRDRLGSFRDDYPNTYSAALGRCPTAVSRWYAVPGNRKWYRNWAVTQLLIGTMEEMKLIYPYPGLDVRATKPSLKAAA
jgi:hypothetical protein